MIVNRYADGEVLRVDVDADWQKVADLAQKVAGQAFDCAGLSVEQIKHEAVKLARPDLDLTGQSTAYVHGWWDALVAAVPGRKDSTDARLDGVDAAASRMAERNRNAWRGTSATETRMDERDDAQNHQREMMRLQAELERRKRLAAQELRHDTAGSDYAERKAEMERYIEESNRLIAEQMRAYNEQAWRGPGAPNNDPTWKQQSPGGASAGGMQPNALHKPGSQGGR